MRKGLIIFLIILLLIVAGLGYLAHKYTGDQTIAEDVQLTVAEGSSTGQIAQLLADKGLVANGLVFKTFAKRQGVDGAFKAGEYNFAAGEWSLEQVCDQLVSGGKSDEGIRVTIREGLTLAQTAQVLADAGLGSVE